MKKLELNQIENLEGGTPKKDCQDRIYGAALGVVAGSAFGGPVSFFVGATIGTIMMAGAVAC